MQGDILQLKKSNCKNCYKCIRECPVKSIKFSEHQAHIIPDECILCGMCFVVCPQNAKQIRDDTALVKEQIKNGRRVVASVAPSFISDFDVKGIEAVEAMLQKLGFDRAEETAAGAFMVKSEYENIIREGRQDVIISSCCHSINTLIQKYFPDALPYLAHTLSPMQAHAKYIKEQDPDAFVVFIGPCISKKSEWEEYGIVDAALTFDELRDWLGEEKISPADVENIDLNPKRSRFFPVPGGIIKSMDTEHTDYTYLAVDGVKNCIEAIREICNGNLNHCFVEMNACEGGCINGPATEKYRHARLECRNAVNRYADSKKTDFDVRLTESIDKKFDYIGVKLQKPGEKIITEILAKMGKTLPEHELNCGACGYNTCRDKAVAIYNGKAEIGMCLPYIKERAESFSDTIINNTPNGIFVLDENLNIQQINHAALQLFHLDNAKSIVNTPIVDYLDPTDYVTIMNDGKPILEKRHYLKEYNKYVEESITYDKDYHIIISIMKDITQEEEESRQKEEIKLQTVEITDKVIEKQMRVVQEIASLLGETTAETKIALTKLKDTMIK